MENKQKHIINPQKLADLWNIQWEHPREMDSVTDEEEYIFTLENNQVLVFNDKNPEEVHFWVNAHGPTTDLITLQAISKVVYSPFKQSLVLESKNTETFSQMMIRSTGKVSISIGLPVSDYNSAAWSQMLEKNMDIKDS